MNTNIKTMIVFCIALSAVFYLSKKGFTQMRPDLENNPMKSGISAYREAQKQNLNKEAITALRQIRNAEAEERVEIYKYIPCDDVHDCNHKLGFNLSGDNWAYKVILNENGYCAQAKSKDGNTSWRMTPESPDPIKGDCSQ